MGDSEELIGRLEGPICRPLYEEQNMQLNLEMNPPIGPFHSGHFGGHFDEIVGVTWGSSQGKVRAKANSGLVMSHQFCASRFQPKECFLSKTNAWTGFRIITNPLFDPSHAVIGQ